MKQVIILVGNICSGKSTLAKMLEKKGYILYPVETLKEELNLDNKNYDKNQELLYSKYADKIIELSKSQKVVAESTGANKYWNIFCKKMNDYFGKDTLSILIDTNKKLCLERFKKNRIGHRKNTRPALIDFIDKKIKSRKVVYDIAISNNSTFLEFRKEIENILPSIVN